MPNESAQEAKSRVAEHQGMLRSVLITLGVVAIGLIGLYLVRSFAATLLVIFAGILLGVFLHGLATLARRWLHLSHGFALALVVVLAVGSFGVFLWLAGPQVARQAQLLGQQLPESVTFLQTRLQQTDWGRAVLSSLPFLSSIQLSFASILGSVSQVFSITMELIGAVIFIFFVGLYLAASPELYLRGGLLLLPREHRARGREVMAALGLALRWWLLGRAITMTLMGILTTLALWWADVPLALVLGIITGLLLFVPYLGAIASAIPAILVSLMDSPAKAFWVAVIYTAVHVFEGYCITPFVQRRAVACRPRCSCQCKFYRPRCLVRRELFFLLR